jgi:two-component system alkaline phosphatase synthesis response regulator PhoP
MSVSMSKTEQIVASILVVDDQPELLENIGFALETGGYIVLTAHSGYEALTILETQPVNLILADIAMPGMNGYQLYERVRENPEWVRIPFLFLTARAMNSDIRFGKELGVDDYLTKPIEVEDLLATVHGKLRRAQQLTSSDDTGSRLDTTSPGDAQMLTIDRLKIEPGQYRAWWDDELLPLSPREFTLLVYLAQRLDQVISPQELVEVTHNLKTDSVEAGNLLRPLIRTLRRKFGYDVGEMGCIENVRGVGYRLISPSHYKP